MKGRVLIIAAILVLWAIAAWADDPVVGFMWTDDHGEPHFAENFNNIPQPFRKTAVKGVFLADKKSKPVKPKCSNANAVSLDTKYYVKTGTLHVEGQIANGYTGSISYVRAKVSFFDAADQFVKAETTFVNPLELAPCEKGAFSVVIPYLAGIANFKVEFTSGAKELKVEGTP